MLEPTKAFIKPGTAAPLTAENLAKIPGEVEAEPKYVKSVSGSSGKWSEREAQRTEVKDAEKQAPAR